MKKNEALLSLYRKLILIRTTEETIARRYSEGKMRCPVHLSIGQEAVAVGVCAALTAEDLVYSTHRCHAHYLAKGGNLNAMMAELYGKATGCCGGKGGSMHLIDLKAGFGGATPIVGNSIPIATGAAFAAKLRKENRVIVSFFGDGTVEEGAFHESLNFAALHKLPIVFVCEDNRFSVYTHLSERQPKRPIYALAKGHGIPASRHDGNDVSTVLAAATKARKAVRSGPVFLEFSTYRYREHCGPNFDDELGYRDPKEVAVWKKKDPVAMFERELLKKEVLSSDLIEKIRNDAIRQVDGAFRFAEKSPFPKREALAEHLYA